MSRGRETVVYTPFFNTRISKDRKTHNLLFYLLAAEATSFSLQLLFRLLEVMVKTIFKEHNVDLTHRFSFTNRLQSPYCEPLFSYAHHHRWLLVDWVWKKRLGGHCDILHRRENILESEERHMGVGNYEEPAHLFIIYVVVIG